MRWLSLLLAMLLLPLARAAGPVDIRFYLERFGGQVKTPEAQAAQAVFERVRAVADRRQAYWPELVVLRHQPGGPALAIPDGHVVLGQQALKSLYQGVSKRLGDTRLAFVLGHELAHFADNDFWHAEASRSLTDWADAAAASPPVTLAKQDAAARQSLELRADDLGFLYAAMAGYPVAELFSEAGNGDFFDGWLASQSAARSQSHPALAKRSRLLKARLRSRAQHVALFSFGVQLARLGRCEDALPLLNRFQREFPNREVLNNQAFCHLQLALEKMPSAKASRFWWPLLIDSTSVLSGGDAVLRSPQLTAAVRRHLQIAVELLDRAVKQDDRYWPAQTNLAIAHQLLGAPFAARAAIEAAFRQQPNNAVVAGTRALLIALQPNSREQGVQLLERLVATAPADAHLVWRYNLAQLNNAAAGNELWSVLAKHSQRLPAVIRAVVCRQQQCTEKPQSANRSSPAIVADALGRDVLVANYRGPQADFVMALAGIDVAVYSNGSDERWLALDGVVELVQKRLDANAVDFLNQHGETVILPMANGQLHRYPDWSALEQNGRITELWLMTQP